MAQLLGASSLSVYKWESGQVTPRATQLERILAVLKLGKRAALATVVETWGSAPRQAGSQLAISGAGEPLLVLLDRVTDPHNVGAILRSAEVFGARAVIAPKHHSAPETGALAKTASGALERQPYLRVQNLAEAMETLKSMGYILLGLDGETSFEIRVDRQVGRRDQHLQMRQHRVADCARGIVEIDIDVLGAGAGKRSAKVALTGLAPASR